MSGWSYFVDHDRNRAAFPLSCELRHNSSARCADARVSMACYGMCCGHVSRVIAINGRPISPCMGVVYSSSNSSGFGVQFVGILYVLLLLQVWWTAITTWWQCRVELRRAKYRQLEYAIPGSLD